MTTITRDEWLKELERVMRQSGPQSDGMTAGELAEQWGCCRRVVLERLNMLRDRIVVGRRRSTSIDGRNTLVACYKLMPTPKAAKKR